MSKFSLGDTPPTQPIPASGRGSSGFDGKERRRHPRTRATGTVADSGRCRGVIGRGSSAGRISASLFLLVGIMAFAPVPAQAAVFSAPVATYPAADSTTVAGMIQPQGADEGTALATSIITPAPVAAPTAPSIDEAAMNPGSGCDMTADRISPAQIATSLGFSTVIGQIAATTDTHHIAGSGVLAVRSSAAGAVFAS